MDNSHTMEKFFLMTVLPFAISVALVSSQGPANNGPIFYGTPNLFCANRAPPHYPWAENWVEGQWSLSHLFQQSSRYPITCGKVSVLNVNETTRYLDVAHKHPNGTTVSRSQFVTKGDYSAPTRWRTSIGGGLIEDSNSAIPNAGSVTFMGFSNLGPPPGQPGGYGTALYAVCYHGGGQGMGPANVAEVGILTRPGETLPDFVLGHYNLILKGYDTLGGGELKPVQQSPC